MNWKQHKLGEIVKDIAMGPFGSNLKVDNFVKSGVPVIRGMNLNVGGFDDGNFVFVSEAKAQSLKRSLAFPHDLVFTHRGTIGQVAIIPKNKFPYYLVSQSQMRLTVNPRLLDAKYLLYWFRSRIGQHELLKNSSQVGVPSIASPTKSLKEIDIKIPDLPTQTAIAEILSSLDDKIELNNQINQNLEALAQAIFKRWFIDFEFPNENGQPYKSSGGEMVESELGEIPKGWEVCELGSILQLSYGKALKAENRVNGPYPVVGSSGIVGLHNEFLVEGPGIVIGRKGTIGEVIWVNENFFPIDTTFYIVDKGPIGLHFIYYLLKLQDFKKIGSDSAVPGLNRNEACRNKVVKPTSTVLNLFGESSKVYRDLIEANITENRYITQLRDTLLPRLVSGELLVAQAETTVNTEV